MKKFIKVLFLLLLAVMLTACNDKGRKDEEESIYASELKDYMESIIPAQMTASFDIPQDFTYSDGSVAILEWESLNTNVINISRKGKLMYLDSLFDTVASIKCSVFVNGQVVENLTFNINVKGEISEADYIKRFNELYIPDSIYKDVEFKYVEDEIFKERKIKGTITYQSSNEDILSSDGDYKYTDSEDTKITISANIEVNGFNIKAQKEVIIEGNHDKEYVDAAAIWLEDNWKGDTTIAGDLDFPKTDDQGKVDMVWESNDKLIVDDSGKFTNWVCDKEITFSIIISMNDYFVTKELKMKTLSEADAIEYIMDKMHKDEYFQSYFYTYIVSGGHANQDFGMLNFYTIDLDESKLVLTDTGSKYIYGTQSYNTNVKESDFKVMMVPRSLTIKRPLETKTSTEFVTCHDTGDNSFNAEQWANEVTTSSRQVSWHFTVDDTQIIQHIPLNEVAYHAGDGGRIYQLRDTGVKYTVENPEIVVDEKTGQFIINGVGSRCFAPYDENGKIATDITPAGLFTTLGKNGNYYINNYYYNSTYKKISNGGGNYNSIGIESCVHNGVEYSKVQKRFANLVAHLLHIYGLGQDRIMQHRNFSGKYCPQSMIRTSEYAQKSQFSLEYFYEMVEIELFIINNLSDLKVTYKSNNPDILSDDGELLKYVSEDTDVSYTVNASYKDYTFSRTYTTTIHPKDN